MDNDLELHALPHPNPKVRRFGFELTDPYLDQCWAALLGPTCIALLRRVPLLWIDEEPARVRSADLARGIGISSASGRRFRPALDRVAGSGFGCWIDDGRALGVYTRLRPIDERRIRRLPAWTQAAHDRLLEEHLDRVAAGCDRPEPNTGVADIATRFDRLQRPPTDQPENSRGIAR